ncbi:mitochondrial carrier [Hesseltinella vesiculosa]|uniref:Mitochondrial carrier n=1 Tax=Hesseltinella vesiculosa TaxID=101127 RepID=A0A1X2GL16_9FUNG|nr:mitochondrial carrier [Hesseltinella vesiculosa]
MADSYTLFAASVAAITARVVTYPIDTIKTRLQTNHEHRPSSSTKLQWFKHTALGISSLKQTSITTMTRQLYRGLPVTLLFSVPALSVYLSCYESSKAALAGHHIARNDHVLNHAMSGAAAEIVAGMIFTPMEVLKNQLQTSMSAAPLTLATKNSTLTLVRSIYHQDGIRGFFRGYWMGLAVFLPHTVVYFVTYEQLKKWMTPADRNTQSTHSYGSQLPWTRYVACSSIASLVSSGLSAPLDVIKTRWQVSSSEQGKSFRVGPVAIAKHMWKYEGRWRGFTKGLLARLIWAMPTTAISMTVFESLKDRRVVWLG